MYWRNRPRLGSSVSASTLVPHSWQNLAPASSFASQLTCELPAALDHPAAIPQPLPYQQQRERGNGNTERQGHCSPPNQKRLARQTGEQRACSAEADQRIGEAIAKGPAATGSTGGRSPRHRGNPVESGNADPPDLLHSHQEYATCHYGSKSPSCGCAEREAHRKSLTHHPEPPKRQVQRPPQCPDSSRSQKEALPCAFPLLRGSTWSEEGETSRGRRGRRHRSLRRGRAGRDRHRTRSPSS